MKPAENQMLSISPDGRHIAFVSSKTDRYCLTRKGQMKETGDENCGDDRKEFRSKHTIIIYDLKTSSPVKTLTMPENFFVSWLAWGSKDRLLAASHRPSSEDRRGRRRFIGGEKIISLPLYGEGYVFLFGEQDRVNRENFYQSEITDFLPNDPEHVIMPAADGSRYSLWKVNILSGEGQVISEGNAKTFAWFTDAKGKPSLRFDCEDGVFCPRISVNVRKLETDGQEKSDWEKAFTFEVQTFQNRTNYDFWPISASPNDGQFYVLSDTDQDDTASIKLYDVKQNKFVETIYQNSDWDVGGALFGQADSAYAGAWFYKDRLEYVFESPDVQRHYAQIKDKFETPQNIRILSYNSKRQRAVVSVSSPDTPGDYYLYDVENGELSFLIQEYPALHDLLFSKTELLDIQTRDGQTVRAYYTTPSEESRSLGSLIVMPHGGPEIRDFYDYDKWVQYFVSHGYSVLQVNFRGSSGYGREFAEAGYGEWGGRMQTDVIDAVNVLYESGRAAPEKTCMMGYSYGGYVALMAGATTPEKFKCIVSGGGLSDLVKTMKADKSTYGANSFTYGYWLKSIGDPKADKDKLEATSPINMAEKFTSPVLLLHGTEDSNTGFFNSTLMEKALKDANKDVILVELEDEDHNDWTVDTSILFLETIKDFLDEHIGN